MRYPTAYFRRSACLRPAAVYPWFSVLILAAFAAACMPTTGTKKVSQPGDAAEVGRFQAMNRFTFAYEAQELCSLEVAKRQSDGTVGAWQAFDHADLVGVTFDVVDREFSNGVLRLEATTETEEGTVFAFRNEKAAPGATAEAWNCAVDIERVAEVDYQPTEKYVRLDAQSCPRLSPVLGTQEEITLSPYTIGGRGIFVANPQGRGAAYRQAGSSVAYLLEAMGGRKRLWLSSEDLQDCFDASDRPPPPPAEAQKLLAWLGSEQPDAVDPPDVSYETVTALTGITKERCQKEKFKNGKSGLACNAPVVRLTADPEPNAFGQRGLNFVQERSVAGIYFQDDRLVSPLLAVNKEVAVTVRGGSRHFKSALENALQPTIEDETKRRQRASSGRYALLSSKERRKATHTIYIQLERQIPEVEITEEPREHQYVAGQKEVSNPAYHTAKQEILEVQEHIAAVTREGALERKRMKVAETACAEGGGELAAAGAGKLAEKVPGGGIFSGAVKQAAKETVAAGCAETASALEKKIAQRVSEAQKALAAAEERLARAPETITVPDERTHTYQAKIYRRSGTAKAKVIVRDRRWKTLFEETVSVPFETTDLEIPDLPEVNLEGKEASPPSVADVEKSLSQALVPLIESSIVRWSAEQTVGESVGEAKRGTRSWAALVASEAATKRPAKLLMDILETRGVESGSARIPVSFPEDAGDKCFTITASDAEGKANVDLILRSPDEHPVARDQRPLIDAAFELCGREAEKYVLEVVTKPGKARAVLVSLFESTPGSYEADELARSTKGKPHSPLANDVFVLDASGKIRASSTNGSVVVGRLGDRDGDGIGDDEDRCPYEAETENYYLDNDGCPDEPPDGFVPDPELVKEIDARRAAAIEAGTASQAQLEAHARKMEEQEAKKKAAEQARRQELAVQKALLAELEREKAEAAKKKRLEQERQRAASALAEAQKARKKAAQERLKAEEERKRAEEERRRAEEERRRKAEERKQAEEERRRKAEERKRAEEKRRREAEREKEKEKEKQEDDDKDRKIAAKDKDDENGDKKKKETEIFIP